MISGFWRPPGSVERFPDVGSIFGNCECEMGGPETRIRRSLRWGLVVQPRHNANGPTRTTGTRLPHSAGRSGDRNKNWAVLRLSGVELFEFLARPTPLQHKFFRLSGVSVWNILSSDPAGPRTTVWTRGRFGRCRENVILESEYHRKSYPIKVSFFSV